MTTVCIFAPGLNHELETVGFNFRTSGTEVVFATQLGGDERQDHPWSLARVQAEKYNICGILEKPCHSELLIVNAFLEPQYADQRAKWASRAKNVAFLFPETGLTTKRRITHLLRSWPHSITARTAIFFGDHRLSVDTLPIAFQRRAFFSPYIHPQFFTDAALNQMFSDFCIKEQRPYSIGFMGNKHPPERAISLAACRRAIEQAGATSFWIEYGDDEHQKALSPDQFIDTLGQLDFCLCPTGWSRWTHRVVESLCRGAIPILQEPQLYGIGLKHLENCILVNDNDWFASVTTALGLPIGKIREMRANILKLRDTMLISSATSSRFCKQFPVESQ